MLSYAQNQEDVLLWRAFSGVDPAEGFYVDVGANHPVVDSVTKHFYDQGWRGINVEPLKAQFDRLVDARPRDVNINAALGAEEGTITLHRVVDNDGLSTVDESLAQEYQRAGVSFVTEEVPVRTLRGLIDEHVEGPVHFLKIDVEGHEEPVIAGGDWERHRPYVVVIESTRSDGWTGHLAAASYRHVLDDGINYVFVAEERADLAEPLSRPVTVKDQFTAYETLRWAEPIQRTLARYGGPALTDDLLAGTFPRPTAGQRNAASALIGVLIGRKDLVRAYCATGELDRAGLLEWALETDPAADADVAELQLLRRDLEALWQRVTGPSS